MWHARERRERCTKFRWESLKEKDHSEDRGEDRNMESEWILWRLAGGVAYIQLAQDRGRWRALVNMVKKLSGSGVT
jgi:hypothetical protein